MKSKKLIEKYNAIQKIGTKVNTPYEVYCLFKDLRTLEIFGDQISFGEDYMSLQETRNAVQWIAEQLGGSVEWEKV